MEVSRRGRDEHQIDIQAVLLVEPSILGDIPVGVGSVHRAIGDLEPLLRDALTPSEAQRQDRKADQIVKLFFMSFHASLHRRQAVIEQSGGCAAHDDYDRYPASRQ